MTPLVTDLAKKRKRHCLTQYGPQRGGETFIFLQNPNKPCYFSFTLQRRSLLKSIRTVTRHVKAMTYKYLIFGISITYISWIVGMIINVGIRKTEFHHRNLSNLNFIQSQYLNKIIGLEAFKWIVKNTFFKFFNQKLKIKNKFEKTDLNKLRNEMTIAEIDHLIGFVFVAIFVLIKFYNFNFFFGLIIMTINILMNLYPSLLQQENKRRIDKLIKKL